MLSVKSIKDYPFISFSSVENWDLIINVKNIPSLQKEVFGEITPLENNIYSFDYTLELPLSVSAAAWQTDENKVNSAKNIYIMENSNKFSDYGYNLYYDFGNNRYRALAGEASKYVLISYKKDQDKNEIIKNLTQYHELDLVQAFQPTESRYLSINGVGDVINNPTSFYDIIKLQKSGPFVEIYKKL